MTHRALIAAALASAMLGTVPALAQTAPPPAISVTGEASVSVPPDQATIDGGVTTEARTAREASEANNIEMGKVLLALKNAGIDGKDLQTSRLSLQPQYANRTQSGPNVLTGYRASNHVTVKLRDVAKLASVIDTMVGAGANEIGGINFMVASASKLLDDARTQAIADAKRKADIYARAAGVALGAPLSISEGGGPGPLAYRKMAVGMAASAAVAPGEETLSVSVNVSWAIKPAGQ
ncbi:MAG: SIMPL domain-containing protein [Rhodopseudomonas sp.]|uniref:SIMPL domain-containing protein n=1 Tax=Rhodopseudomonas sp. TaxID=1078 RepID=UPI0017F18980|nr:SIMPL domain-containing protein [Rhodopseudomonas sp.]NVN85798.1 SIMPL domain-containing protein [Rhodopseudomonas sp.]